MGNNLKWQNHLIGIQNHPLGVPQGHHKVKIWSVLQQWKFMVKYKLTE